MLDQLLELNNQVCRRAELKNIFAQKRAEKETLEKSLFALKIAAHNEQVDVDLLNSFSIKNLYYELTGKKEALLEKESREARAARAEYDNAQFRLEQLCRQMESCEMEMDALSGCEDRYWQALMDAEACAHSDDRQAVTDLITQRLHAITAELEEALALGSETDTLISGLLDNVHNVQEWNIALSGTAWDMTMQGYLNTLQNKLNEFRKEAEKFRGKLNGLPLPGQIMTDVEQIFIFPEDHLRELTSKIGADTRLCDADTALCASRRSLNRIIEAMRNVLMEKSRKLAEYK